MLLHAFFQLAPCTKCERIHEPLNVTKEHVTSKTILW